MTIKAVAETLIGESGCAGGGRCGLLWLRQPSDPTARAVVFLAWFLFHQSIQVEALVELEQYSRTRTMGLVRFRLICMDQAI
ncbi:hypothetical protein J3U01_04000 [Bifidobacterium sp. B4107]|uniref:hypothetical protein n=1 Tax=unclassified Bifidobacterium TaxID=2608897 RepID=UPI002269D2E2|nr:MULTISPECIES: hypothetical protein [unclassified Bifidobacterium]MCX8647576.1 hypothetical protein [Bifidobacterium sp. B4107]MCX8651756.1 hypothetical protein [Bifidobacterium sp. B4111]MCX8658608.1 hypothetical protein [Bifidobacterium sp. B4114]MCX8688215.1 hypothetical protein [Bifidobacterium sp. B4142]